MRLEIPLVLLLAAAAYGGSASAQSGLTESELLLSDGPSTYFLTYGDLTGNGVGLVALNRIEPENGLFYADGVGGTWETLEIPLPAMSNLGFFFVADYDRDGLDDLVTRQGHPGQSVIAWYRNVGGADGPAFAAPVVLVDEPSVTYVESPRLADLNGDGYPDLLYAFDDRRSDAEEGFYVALNNRGRGAIAPTSPLLGTPWDVFLAGDFDGDGDEDLLAREGFDTAVLRGDGTGGFSDTNEIAFPSSLAMGWYDLDGDRQEEVVSLTTEEVCAPPSDGGCDEPIDVLALVGQQFGEDLALNEVWRVRLSAVPFDDGDVRELVADPAADYSLQPGDFAGNGRPDLLVTEAVDGVSRRYFLTVTFPPEGAPEGPDVSGVAADVSELDGALPFVRAAGGDYVRGNWDSEGYLDPIEVYVERVLEAETDPPDVPSGVSATYAGPGALDVAWMPPTGAEERPLTYSVEVERDDGTYRYRSDWVRAFSTNWTSSSVQRWAYAQNRTPRTEAAFRDLAPGTYTVRISAVDVAGRRSARSAPATVVVMEGPAPSVPAVVAAEAVTGGIEVTYRMRGLIDSVGVYRRAVASEEESRLLAIAPVGETRYVDADVDEGQTYEYRLEAYLDAASSPLSEPAVATAPGTAVVPVWLPYEGERLTGSLTYDLDADGYLDLVGRLLNALDGSSRFVVVPGSEAGFDAGAAVDILETDEVMGEGWPFRVGDWDGDGDGDLVTSAAIVEGGVGYGMEPVVWTLDGLSPTGFFRYEAQAESGTGNSIGVVDVADLDLDGRADMIMGADRSVVVGWSEPDGTVTFERVITDGVNTWQVTRIDYDQDGRPDLLVTTGTPESLTLLHNEGGRAFAPVPSGLGAGIYFTFRPLWLTDDPYPDLLVAQNSEDKQWAWSLYAYDESTASYAPHPLDVSALAGDNAWPVHLDADGDVDFVQILPFPARIALWYNDANAALRLVEVPLSSGVYLLDAYNVDYDRDGVPDALLRVSGSDDGFLLVRGTPGEGDVGAPTPPTGLSASGDADELVLSWTPSGGGLPAYTAYAVVMETAGRTVVVGEVDPEAGVARTARGDAGVHGGAVRLRGVAPGTYSVRVAALDAAGRSSGFGAPLTVAVTPVGVEGSTTTPRTYLHQSVPNPTKGSAVLAYELARAGDVTLRVYDVLGREVRTLVEGHREAGRHEVGLPGGGLTSGVYLYRLVAGESALTRRMVVVE